MSINDVLTKIITFIIIILLGLIISKVVSNLFRKLIKEFEVTKVLKKADIKFNPNKFIPSLSKYFIYLLTIIIALNAIGITKIVVRIIVSFSLSVLIIYILISVKDLIPNWYNGLKVKRKYKVGDKIKYKNIEGKIIYMNSVELQVQSKKEVIYLPYKLVK